MNAIRRACAMAVVLAAVPLVSLWAQPDRDGSRAAGGLPAPKWVEMVDQGASDPQLRGIHTPRGIKVELAQSRQDGEFNPPAEFAAWTYLSRGQEVLRRRAHNAELLKTFRAAAEAEEGPPTSASADGKWIEQVLIRGLDSSDDRDPPRITVGPDALIYVACHSGNHRAESWDGSKAVVIRSGAIFRLRPDGSCLEEFARGLAHPSGLAFDDLGNAFCLDRGVPETSFSGARLIHVLPGGDYGWLAAQKSPAAKAADRAKVEPDPVRAAAAGQRPGTLPPMLPIPQGVFGNPLICRGAAFPESLQNVLIVPDQERHALAVFVLVREGATFRATSQFDLIRSHDDRFQPESIRQGLDGAIDLVDRRGDQRRLFRLSWSGHGDLPALPLLSPDRLAGVKNATDDELCKLLASTDFQVRQAAAYQIIAAATGNDAQRSSLRQGLVEMLQNERLPPAVLASVIQASGFYADKAIRQSLCKLIDHENSEVVRLAATALGESPPSDPEELAEVGEFLKGAYGRVSPAASERAIQMVLARLAIAGVPDAAEWGFEATSVMHGPKMSRYTFDGHVRALEMVPGAAKELMLGNLDVAINLDVTGPMERQRLKEFVTLTAESMRTRELSEFLDALLRGQEDLFVKIEAPLEARLIACYQNVLVDPPINADAAIEWLDKHPGGPVEVEIAALETLANVGTTKKEAFDQLRERLLADPAIAATLAQRLIVGHLDRRMLPQIRQAVQRHAQSEKIESAAKLLAELDKLDR